MIGKTIQKQIEEKNKLLNKQFVEIENDLRWWLKAKKRNIVCEINENINLILLEEYLLSQNEKLICTQEFLELHHIIPYIGKFYSLGMPVILESLYICNESNKVFGRIKDSCGGIGGIPIDVICRMKDKYGKEDVK